MPESPHRQRWTQREIMWATVPSRIHTQTNKQTDNLYNSGHLYCRLYHMDTSHQLSAQPRRFAILLRDYRLSCCSFSCVFCQSLVLEDGGTHHTSLTLINWLYLYTFFTHWGKEWRKEGGPRETVKSTVQLSDPRVIFFPHKKKLWKMRLFNM